MFKCRAFFTPFWRLRRKHHEESDAVDDCISHTDCGRANCHCLSGGQFGKIFQMRKPFDLKVSLVRIIPKEIIREEGKDECAKTFVIVRGQKIVPINRRKVTF